MGYLYAGQKLKAALAYVSLVMLVLSVRIAAWIMGLLLGLAFFYWIWTLADVRRITRKVRLAPAHLQLKGSIMGCC